MLFIVLEMIKNVLEKRDTLRARVFSHYGNTASRSGLIHFALGVAFHDEKNVHESEQERIEEVVRDK